MSNPYNDPSFLDIEDLSLEDESSDLKNQKDFKKDLEHMITQQVKTEFNTLFNEEITGSLEEFQESLIQKVKNKTFHKIKSEILSQEDIIADKISQKMVDFYRKEVLSSLRHKQIEMFDPQVQKKLEEEIEETNVYLGYRPRLETMRLGKLKAHHHSSEQQLVKPVSELTKEDSAIDHQEFAYEDDLKNQFISSLSLHSIVYGMLCFLAIYLLSPLLFFKSPSIIMCLAIIMISISLCALTEMKYFIQRGLSISLRRRTLVFRVFRFFFKMCFVSLILGFFLLSDLNFHAMNFYQASPFIPFWWIGITNKWVGFLQMGLSYSTLTFLQEILLAVLCLFSFFVLSKIFINQRG